MGRWGRWGRWGLFGMGGRSRCVAGVVGVPDFALFPHAARVRAIARMAHVARVLVEFTMPFPMLQTRVGRQIAGRCRASRREPHGPTQVSWPPDGEDSREKRCPVLHRLSLLATGSSPHGPSRARREPPTRVTMNSARCCETTVVCATPIGSPAARVTGPKVWSADRQHCAFGDDCRPHDVRRQRVGEGCELRLG